MKKHEALTAWRALPDNLPILPHFRAIEPSARGSRYGACGIRIDGNPQFVDAVLSHLKDLIDGENTVTRLGLSRAAVDGSGIGKVLENADDDAEVCYIRLYLRGPEGAMAAAFFEKALREPTKRYAEAIGVNPAKL
jgi:hypothetical protein